MPNIIEKYEIVLYTDDTDTLIFNESETDEQCTAFKINNKVIEKLMIVLYRSLSHPMNLVMQYYIHAATNIQLDRIKKLQNRAMRSVIKCNRFTPIYITHARYIKMA